MTQRATFGRKPDKDLGVVALQACVRAQFTADMADARAARRRALWRVVGLAFAVLVVADLVGIF